MGRILIDLLLDLPFTLHESNCQIFLLISFERTRSSSDITGFYSVQLHLILYKADTSLRRTARAGPEGARFRDTVEPPVSGHPRCLKKCRSLKRGIHL